MILRKPPIAVLALLVSLSACSGGGSTPHAPASVTPTSNGHAKRPADVLGGVGGLLKILLCDAPPRIGNMTPTEIDLAVDSVGVVANGTVVPIAQYDTPQIVNVLQAQGDPSSIGIGDFFSGQYQQVQFTFDIAQSHIVADGTSYPITFLAGDNSLSSAGAGSTTTTTADGGKVTVNISGNYMIGSNPAASIQADFNALESLAQDASGAIVSRPTLFAVPYTEAGKIAGTVVNSNGAPVEGATVVALDSAGNVANSVSTDASGAYELHTVVAGNYSIVVYNTYKTAAGQTLQASGNTNSAQSVAGPSVTVERQDTTQVPAIND